MSISARKLRVPKYRHYKPKDLAVVRIDGHDHYLGKHGSPESREKYDRLIAQWLGNGRRLASPEYLNLRQSGSRPTINEVIHAYWQYAKPYYRKNGRSTGESDNIRAALRTLRQLYGSSVAGEFGPDDLVVVRNAMIKSGLSRKVINGRIGRIKRMFRWAAQQVVSSQTAEGMKKRRFIPRSIYHELEAVEGLKRGRSDAHETEPVKPVLDEHVAAICPLVTPTVAAMVQAQRLTGMRPQDIRNMRTCDVDMASEIWVYRPWTHKTEHHGHIRQIAIGPKAQAILKPFLKLKDPESYVFSPKAAVAEWKSLRRRQRKSRRTSSELAKKPRPKPKRRPGDQYTKSSYGNAIRKACKKAAVPHWAPNQLRHGCATEVRIRYGIEGSAAVLGNSLGMVVEVYAKRNFDLAIQIMKEIG